MATERQVPAQLLQYTPKPTGYSESDAYCYDGGTSEDTEKAIMCVAYLMEWTTDAGNRDLDREAADGLSKVLRSIADDAARHRWRAENKIRT